MNEYISIASVTITIISIIVTIYFYDRSNVSLLGRGSLGIRKIKNGVIIVVNKIKKDNFRPDIIVSINSISYGGGPLVGDMLSAKLSIPMEIINIDIREETARILFDANRLKFNANAILIVDDICNTGRILKLAYDAIKQYNSESIIKVAVVLSVRAEVLPPVRIDFSAYESRTLTYRRTLFE